MTDRFWRKVVRPDEGCWQWTGGVGSHGYGQFTIDGRPLLAHRYSYETKVGPIPADLTIDHLCVNKRCVNPDHLDVVTRAENGRRGERLRKTRGSGSKPITIHRETCCNGHPYEDGSFRMYGPTRICRVCARARSREFRERQRG